MPQGFRLGTPYIIDAYQVYTTRCSPSKPNFYYLIGGLRDVTCSEPVVRYMLSREPNTHYIGTHHPELFKHLPAKKSSLQKNATALTITICS